MEHNVKRMSYTFNYSPSYHARFIDWRYYFNNFILVVDDKDKDKKVAV